MIKYRLFNYNDILTLWIYRPNKRPKQMQWTISRYGSLELTMLVAYKSILEHRRVDDYYIINDNQVDVYVYSQLYGICKVMIDLDDIGVIYGNKISIYKNRYTMYAWTKEGQLHRNLFSNVKDKKRLPVDHINKNGLDNRRSNLRLCTYSINAINSKRREDNQTGVKGVSIERNPDGTVKKYRAELKIPFSRYISKTFSVAKYGEAKAFALAISARRNMEKLYNYDYTEEGSETKSDIGLDVSSIPVDDNIRKLMANSMGNITDKLGITLYW